VRLPDFQSFSLGINGSLFAVAAVAVWWSGTRLTAYADAISQRLGGKPALVGLVLLGSVASLPEMATTVSAALLGHAPLAVNTLLGGISITLVILAIVDGIAGHEPLSVDVTHPVLLLQAALAILLLTVAASGAATGDRIIPGTGVGLCTTSLLVLYIACVMLVRRYERSDPWIPKWQPEGTKKSPRGADAHRHLSRRKLAWASVGVAAVVVVAGFVLASTGDAIAQQTGISEGFIGLMLGGIATSLPELSTTLSAIKLRQYEMAFGDVFGTNLFSTMLLFFADLAYRGEPILNVTGRFSLFAILLAIALTAIYLAGLIERRNYSILGMGVDSLCILAFYVVGVVILLSLN
jgi:cation:H+ antiporter